MEEEQMPKVNFHKDSVRLTTSDLHHMKRIEEQNLERVNKLKKFRYKNRILGSCLAGIALSIYGYTMYAIKQETFLDDFEEPEKISDKQ